jgi:Rad3-related DNA helicase
VIEREDWEGFFPFSAPRQEQVDAINFILNSFLSQGKRFVIADLGTGVGKSAIAVTVARYLNAHDPPPPDKTSDGKPAVAPGAWFLTTQKILQEQYLSDFGGARGNMKSIRSSANYTCGFYKKINCSEGQQMLRAADQSSRFWKSCMMGCKYKQEKKAFVEASESVTNFSYALTESSGGSGKIGKRNLLVIDECHNADPELSRHIELTITDRTAGAIGVEWPEVTTHAQAVKWIKEAYLLSAQRVILEMERDVQDFKGLEGHEKEYADLVKKTTALKSHIDKVTLFLQVQTSDNWVFEILPAVGGSGAKMTFKPIDVSPFAEDTLFRLGRRVLLMSATVIRPDIFAESLGIPESQRACLTIPTPFPVENRPIHVFPVGRMSADNIDETLPKMVTALKEILKEHKGEKGMIHCHSFKIANYLRKNLRSNRLIFHDSSDREEALKKHLSSKEPTVLVSPSMAEGVDLRDDLARFQILLKVPYPSLGDKLVRKRMHRWSWWYPMQTVKTVVQSVGRAIRSEKDHAVTYILDADWVRFYNQNQELFPDTFRLAVKGG